MSIPFIVQRLGMGQLGSSLAQLGILALFWYLTRKGESWGYWGLVVISFGFAARWTWGLLTPPPSPFGWTVLQTVRTAVHVAAGAVLLLPATRVHVNHLRDSSLR